MNRWRTSDRVWVVICAAVILFGLALLGYSVYFEPSWPAVVGSVLCILIWSWNLGNSIVTGRKHARYGQPNPKYVIRSRPGDRNAK